MGSILSLCCVDIVEGGDLLGLHLLGFGFAFCDPPIHISINIIRPVGRGCFIGDVRPRLLVAVDVLIQRIIPRRSVRVISHHDIHGAAFLPIRRGNILTLFREIRSISQIRVVEMLAPSIFLLQ